MSDISVAIYCCSPRPRGNSDLAGELLRDVLSEAGVSVDMLYLRKYKILPCQGCNRCRHDKDGRCYLSDQDQSSQAFAPMLAADRVFLVSPIYFYHLPSPFKAFIDRSQTYYLRRQAGNPKIMSLPHRYIHPVLIAGRSKGEKLFDGSLLTLKYFVSSFNMELADPMLLKGLDEEDDLASNDSGQEKIREYGRIVTRDLAKKI